MFPTPAQRDLAGFATKLAAYGETPRYWRINRFEAFYNGQQYDGRPSFWDNAYPLRERAPAVQTGFARAAVNRLATLVFGDRSFPRLTVGNRVLRAALSDAERKALQALVERVGGFEVDEANAVRVHSSSVRGFANLPITVKKA